MERSLMRHGPQPSCCLAKIRDKQTHHQGDLTLFFKLGEVG
jgi:hypothetical protein